MLCLTGIICRILYEDEMTQIAQLYNRTDDREWLEERAAHALAHFTFRQSTPNERVGEIIKSQFFNCTSQKLSILSTNGVLPISDVRIPNPKMLRFIKKVPVVSEIVFKKCHTFFGAKDTMNLIRELDLQDVLCELESRTLSEDEVVDLLKWWISYRSEGNQVKSMEFSQFMRVATIRMGDKSRALDEFRYFLNPGIIPPNVGLPDDIIPYNISENLQEQRKGLENVLK